MHKYKENLLRGNVISIPDAGHDSLESAINQFLMWEMRSRDCIEVKRCYIDVALDLESGVLLSQIVYWHLPDSLGKQKLTVYRDGYWWLAKGRSNWWAECRLTPKQFDRAIRQLEQQQLVCTQVYKWQGQNTKHIRIDWTGLLQALSILDASSDSVIGFRRRELVRNVSGAIDKQSEQDTPELTISQSSRLPNGESDELPNSQSSGFPISQPKDFLLGDSQIPKKGSSELPNREFHLYTEITSKITPEITTLPPNPPSDLDPCEGNNLPGQKTGGSLADLPAGPLDQFELLGNKNCHNSQFSAALEKQAGSQPGLPASLLDQSELTEKQDNFGQDKNSAAALSIAVELAAIQPHTPLDRQAVVADLGQPTVGQDRSAPFPRSQNESRASRHQPHLPKNLDGSDRLPWDTEKRGVFDPKFENWMARSLMQYPAYRDLMAGELMTKVRKHISAGRYDLKRRDELLIEWSAMLEHQNANEFETNSSTLTAKGAARRAKIARALSMEVS